MPEIDVRHRETEDRPHRRRSVVVSPAWRFSPPGSRWGGFNLSFSQLRELSKKSPTVQAIVELRQNQVASFARSPRHRGDRGFEIVRRDDPGKMTDHDKKITHYAFEFIMGTGAKHNPDRKFTFADWMKATIRDIYIVGAGTTELVYDEDGRLSEFWAIDAATIEMQWAERYIPTTRYGRQLDQPVKYVQVVDGQIETEYADDELLYMVLNPITDIANGGYPISNAEACVDWIAAEVLAMQYNSNYFDHGSVPPGILAIIGNYSDETLMELRRMWKTDVKGVVGQHQPVALGVREGKKIEWIPMKSTNREMEMGDFLDKLTTKICAVFGVDPVEIGQRTAANTGAMSSSDNTVAKIDLGRARGLIPLLDLLEMTINTRIMPVLAPGYIFRFTGINMEDEQGKVEFLNQQLSGGAITAREWRMAMGLEPEPASKFTAWLDAPGNPQLLQVWMQESGMQQQQQQQQAAGAQGIPGAQQPGGKNAGMTGLGTPKRAREAPNDREAAEKLAQNNRTGSQFKPRNTAPTTMTGARQKREAG